MRLLNISRTTVPCDDAFSVSNLCRPHQKKYGEQGGLNVLLSVPLNPGSCLILLAFTNTIVACVGPT